MRKLLRTKILPLISSQGLKERAIRGSFWTIASIGGKQFIRLASNLVLTRILYPEAFGLMALINSFMYGLTMFSNLGAGASVIQNKRGDDEDFLNTAWTMQAARGGLLFFMSCLLAWPFASVYGEGMLLQLIPIVGISAILSGFNPTTVLTANRHLQLGRVTILALTSQALSAVVLVVLALLFKSVWALAIGAITSALLQLLMYTYLMPGKLNKFYWDKEIGSEIFSFGKWIFLSTLCAFLINQGDRFILGYYLDTAVLGVYSIAFMLAVLPTSLTTSLATKVLFPLYRKLLPFDTQDDKNLRKLFKTRFMISTVFVSASIVLAFVGPYLIEFLYDERYHGAKGMITLLSVAMIPRVVLLSAEQIPMAAGDSKGYATIRVITSIIQTLLMIVGGLYWGVFAIACSFGLSMLLTYPIAATVTNRHSGWMPKHDFLFLIFGLLIGSTAIWFHWAEVSSLIYYQQ